jgi:hypothetical protein
MTKAENIPIPKRLQDRPQWRGLPIPFIAFIATNGEPDFRVIDQEKRMYVAANHLCQLCGEKLGRYIFYVGGPNVAKYNQYFEPPLHLDCLIYAMQVCPFIVGKITDHANIPKVQAKHEHEGVIISADETFKDTRDPEWVIKKATGLAFGQTSQGTILFLPTGVICQTEDLYPDRMGPQDWEKVKQKLERSTAPSPSNI